MNAFERALVTSIAIFGNGFALSSFANGYNPVIHEAQSRLAKLGFDPGLLNGELHAQTVAAIRSFQTKEGLPATAALDDQTLDKLNIGISPIKVMNWRAPPTQPEINQFVSKPINDPNFPYTDYRPHAASANMDLPGDEILLAMNDSANKFGSRRPGQPGHNPSGYKALRDCLKTKYAPSHWSDLAIHYYCQMYQPRACYTYETSGKRPPPAAPAPPLSRPAAYNICAAGGLPYSSAFSWVVTTQPLAFQYVMFGQTHAFNHQQEQSIINAFYGVNNPTDRAECNQKRPRRTEDPVDGTHCLVNKTMTIPLAGRGR